MTKEIAVKTMAEADARAFVSSINARIGDIREMVIELHDHRGWEALGYASWKECVKKEFDWSESYSHRLVAAGKIERKLLTNATKDSPIGKSQPPAVPIPETHIRPLAGLTEKQQIKAYTDARAAAEKAGKPLTAKDVKAKADAYKPATPAPQPAPKACDCGGSDAHEDGTCASCPQEDAPGTVADVAPPPGDKKKAGKLFGQLVRELDALGIDWKKLTLQQVKDALRS